MTWVMRAWKHDGLTVDAHVESKSTSGGLMMANFTVVKHWSRTQVSRALSTAEAEYYSVAMGDRVRGFVYGQTSMQPKRLIREEGLERPDILN